MSISPESFIDYQPTVAPIEAGGQRVEVMHFDEITFAVNGLKETIRAVLDPKPEAVELELPERLPFDYL